MITKEKVFAYITQDSRLLVFDHVHHPEAGTQVPAGTLKPGESPEAGVLREAAEETGLTDLTVVAFLGTVDVFWPEQNQLHHRHFFHLRCDQSTSERWQHVERYASDGSGEILFELYWVDLNKGVPDLVGGHGALMDQITIGHEER